MHSKNFFWQILPIWSKKLAPSRCWSDLPNTSQDLEEQYLMNPKLSIMRHQTIWEEAFDSICLKVFVSLSVLIELTSFVKLSCSSFVIIEKRYLLLRAGNSF
jgi:hypothetical protein